MQIGSQKEEIDQLYSKIRDYVWVQDQLYKDYVKVEKHYKKKKEEYVERIRQLEYDVQAERERCVKAEAALKACEKPADKEH